MTTLSDIKWGSYKGFEGPYYHGKWPIEIIDSPTKNEKIVLAITATEGGTYDAVNMYDSCIMTVGIIQWCDRWNLVTKMLGYISNKLGPERIRKPLANALKISGATWKKNKNAQWRFFIGKQECSTPETLRNLYFDGASGKKGE